MGKSEAWSIAPGRTPKTGRLTGKPKCARGRYIDPRSVVPLTFEEWASRWLQTYRRPGPTRIDHVRRILAKHLYPTFGPVLLRDLTPRTIQEWVYAEIDRGCAPGSVRG